MALTDSAWYVDDGDNSTTGWWGITAWSNNGGAGTAFTAGMIRRQSGTPTVGNERIYICVAAGTGGTGADPLTVFTRGNLITDAGATWQEATGIAALNGDATNTPNWTTVKAVAAGVVTLGQVIQRNNGASYQICTVGGTVGAAEPAGFSDTAGVTTADNTATWTSLGVVGGFSIFGAPHARLANAFTATWGQAGNSFYIHSTSAETQTTTITLTSPGTLASPCYVASVGTGAVPPTSVTAGASISTTSTGAITFGVDRIFYEGVNFSAGSAGNSATITFGSAISGSFRFDNCGFTLGNTNTASRFTLYGANADTASARLFNGCTWTFGSSTSQGFSSGTSLGLCQIKGGSMAVGANIPTTVFLALPANLLIQGVDLSAFGSGKTLIGASANNTATIIQDCKLNASVTIATTPTTASQKVYLVSSDSSGTNYRQEKYDYYGTQTTETTIVRTGGASAGTPISWKVVPTANAKWGFPFQCLPLRVWNPTITPTDVTVTIHGIWSGGAVPTNKDCWMSVEYLGTSGSPLGIFNSGTVASNLVSSSPQGTDGTSTWGGSTTAFQMATTLSPKVQIAGYFNISIYVGANSGTFYFDPLAVLS